MGFGLHLERTIPAAHYLKYYEGKCNQLHGHSFKITVDIEREHINSMSSYSDKGMVVDFKCIKNIIDKFDHKCINDVLREDRRVSQIWELSMKRLGVPEEDIDKTKDSPTAELLSVFIAYNVDACIVEEDCIVKVRVEEEQGQWASYTIGGNNVNNNIGDI